MILLQNGYQVFRIINVTHIVIGTYMSCSWKTALVGKNHAYQNSKDMDFWSEYSHWGKNKPVTEGERAISKFFKEAVGQYLEPSPIPLKDQQPTRIVDEAIEWIDSQKDNPFFVWISFPEPHNPYQVCEVFTAGILSGANIE